jgi:AcrR family transcriptional regulator
VARREQILAAALRAFDERGVFAATLDDIRAGSGASVGSIYHHFAGKEGIAEALYADVLGRYQDGFLGALGDDARAGVRGVVEFHLRWALAHPAEMRYLLVASPSGEAVRTRNRSFFAAVRAWWAGQPELPELDLALSHALWLGPATELCRHWLAGRAPRPTRTEIELLSDAAWRSLTT